MLDVRPRVAWQEAHRPVTGPVPNRSLIEAIVYHYPGGSASAVDEAAMIASLRKSQAYYLAGQPGRPGTSGAKYSYGYNFVIDKAGRVWEVRGFDVACAANGSSSWNARAIAVQLFVGPSERPNDAQVDAARRFAARCENEYGRSLTALVHSQVRSMAWPRLSTTPTTSCPGPIIRAMVAGGEFAPLRVEGLDRATMEAVKQAEKPVIGAFATGFVVAYLQQVLKIGAGQDVPLSGVFEGRTYEAVLNIQRFFGLRADGSVGAETWPVVDWIAGAHVIPSMA